MNTEHPTAQSEKGRDERGRFTAGNRGGPGNPFARQVAALRRALLDSVTPRDIQDVADKLVALAKEGDVQAAKLLFSYVIGKPQPAPEPDRMDADEWDVYRQTTPMKQEAAAIVSAGVPEAHLGYVRTLRPVISALVHEQVMAIVNETPEARAERVQREDEEMERFLNSPAPQFDFDDEPSANGVNGAAHPSANGVNGVHPPSANGKKRRAPAPPDRGAALPT